MALRKSYPTDDDLEDVEISEFPCMRDAVRKSVETADHLEDTDEADIQLAYQLADIIDDARESGDPDAIHKTAFGPMPTLHKVLTSLGLNPEGRDKLGLNTQEDDEDW
ncbi:hypothetical protein ACL1HT_00725 [Corynebacterium striatum]|uniref:terminase small subunit n=1 Tax=Corynebacterium striatum TaxID=43770 RepID=UPI000673CE03|nr:hypothetical protein [Corynebacterium phage IME1320_01]EGT5575717.1 hypothetical protein [Corynebacterium striatum]NHY37554.1 hypothetical protein [Corynebacterium striatum]CQD13395.1 hypothetical protein U2A4042520203 [Corynebacterium striatum]HAT1161243.1 hypothetical protein [Corynebacterium striatum]